jgi:hypothetical protein
MRTRRGVVPVRNGSNPGGSAEQFPPLLSRLTESPGELIVGGSDASEAGMQAPRGRWRGAATPIHAAAAAFSVRLQASRPPRVAHVPAATLGLRLAPGAPAPSTPTDPSVTPLVTSRSVFTEQQSDLNRLL